VRALFFRAALAAVLVLAVLSLIAARRMRFEHAMLLAEVVELRDIAEKQNRLLWNHGLIPYLLPPRLAAAWWNVEDAVSLLETVGSWGTPGVPK
jgi:hypothetical protein